MANYGYDGADGYYGGGSAADYHATPSYAAPSYAAPSYTAEPQYSNPYPDNQYSGYSSQVPSAFPARTPAINYNKHKRPSGSMILQEDLDAEAAAQTVPKTSLLLNHSSAPKRPYSGDSGFQASKFSRGSGVRGGGRGGRGGYQRGGRGGGGFGGDSGGRGGVSGRGTGDRGRGRVRGGITLSVPEIKSVAGKHPAQAIVDIFPGATFETVATNKYVGLSNRWIVTLTCPSHNNQVFVGAGPNEKVAKHEAGYAALQHITPDGFSEMTSHLNGDLLEQVTVMREFRLNPGAGEYKTKIQGDVTVYLMKLYSVHAEFLLDDPLLVSPSKPPRTVYKATLKVGEQVFEEVAANKKKAKELVVYTCLKHFEVKPPKFMRVQEEGIEGADNTFDDPGKLETLQDKLAAKVFQTIDQKTEKVCKDFISTFNVAGILLQSGEGSTAEDYEVISVGVGTGSVDAKRLKQNGSVIHDWHAEILAIRAFRLYLFGELDKAIDGKDSILEKIEGSDKYRIMFKYKVVMLKNVPPTGDALVIESTSKKSERNPNKRNSVRATSHVTQGNPGAMQFRCSNGNKYLTEELIEKRGQAKHVIACPSDKLAVCNIAGLQGALLSQFLDPVYIQKYMLYKSFFLSVPAVTRALYERIEAQIYKVPLPYKITKPDIETYSVRPPRILYNGNDKMNNMSGWALSSGQWEVIKSPEGMAINDSDHVSVIHADCQDDVEYYEKKLANAKKIRESMRPSQLSKIAGFGLYTKLCQKVGKEIPSTYFACKALADEYHAVKLSINNAFSKAKLGAWPAKSVNTEVFKVDESIDIV
ncbi:double-stranded RNA-specific editase Adar-like [Bolinopsis microptera]|uniref:double-stranded RNA-specific editase Adar-like n=1 Tax=Bolinopsis microptera TaxID=2820187 RepID=UPI0030793EFE